MQAEFIRHVCGLIRLIHLLLLDPHRLGFVAVGEVVSRLGYLALQDLHKAVRVAVVVDRTALPRRPHKDKLFKRGKPWLALELADGDFVSILMIQGQGVHQPD